MGDMLKAVLELVKAQATVRGMTADEMTAMLGTLEKNLQSLSQPSAESTGAAPVATVKPDAAKSIRETAATCLECGKVCKIIVAKHSALHGLDADVYREKWGLKKGTPRACRALARVRRKKMKEMQLWERRKSAAGAKPMAAEAAPATGKVAKVAPAKPKADRRRHGTQGKGPCNGKGGCRPPFFMRVSLLLGRWCPERNLLERFLLPVEYRLLQAYFADSHGGAGIESQAELPGAGKAYPAVSGTVGRLFARRHIFPGRIFPETLVYPVP